MVGNTHSSMPGRPSPAVRVFAGVAALLGWVALGTQLWLTVATVLGQGRGLAMALVVYLGFFTILTNLLAAWVLSACSIGPRFPGYRLAAHPVVITSVAAAITIVGAVYFLILRHLWKPEGAQFLADAALHYLQPVLMVLFWAWVVPAGAIRWRHAPWLFVYPLAYLVYVFVRGEMVGLYPYDFVDVLKLGYPAALRNAAGLMGAYALVASVFVGLKSVMFRQSFQN